VRQRHLESTSAFSAGSSRARRRRRSDGAGRRLWWRHSRAFWWRRCWRRHDAVSDVRTADFLQLLRRALSLPVIPRTLVRKCPYSRPSVNNAAVRLHSLVGWLPRKPYTAVTNAAKCWIDWSLCFPLPHVFLYLQATTQCFHYARQNISEWYRTICSKTRSPAVARVADRTVCHWPSTSFKVNDFHVIWKPVWDFLLVINSNLSPISHRLATIHLWRTTDRRRTGDNRTISSIVKWVRSAKKTQVLNNKFVSDLPTTVNHSL